MPDDLHPDDSPSFRRGGPAAIFAVEVRGPQHAVVVMAVDHRDHPGTAWSVAGSLSALAPAESALRVSDLKQELRLRFAVLEGASGLAEVRVLPPVWLPH